MILLVILAAQAGNICIPRTYPISHIIVFHRGQLRISRGGSGVFFSKMYTFYMLLLQLFVLVCFFFNGLMYLSMHLYKLIFSRLESRLFVLKLRSLRSL